MAKPISRPLRGPFDLSARVSTAAFGGPAAVSSARSRPREAAADKPSPLRETFNLGFATGETADSCAADNARLSRNLRLSLRAEEGDIGLEEFGAACASFSFIKKERKEAFGSEPTIPKNVTVRPYVFPFQAGKLAFRELYMDSVPPLNLSEKLPSHVTWRYLTNSISP